MAQSIVILRNSTLQPVHPTKRHRLPLSGVDVNYRDLPYVRVILFYKTDIEHVSVIDTLKQGLSAVLLHFYPLAGRLVECDDGIVALDCNDAGVEFVEASLDFYFSELEEDAFAMRDFFRDLTRFDGQHRDNPEDPLLSVQVTSFLGGGIAVGCAFNHVTADGHSLWHFMNSWAECCKGLSVSVPPLHMRTALKPQRQIQVEVPDLKLPRKATDSSGRPFNTELTNTVMHLTEAMIKRLKRGASAEAGKAPITSFQALTAHLWKRLTMAQEPLNESRKLALLIPVNVRGKMNVPTITAAYFGNALVGATVLTTAGELRRESIGATAARIHEAIRSVDAAYIEGEVRRTDSRDHFFELVRARRLTGIVMSPRFPVYETDFGWGKPKAARSPVIRVEGVLAMYPGKEVGSVDVCLALPAPTLEAFLSQEDEVSSD